VRALLDATTPKLVPDLIRDSKMRTPLLVACAAGNADVVKVLVEHGADPNCLTGDIVGNKPLDLAVISNSVDTVIALLNAGMICVPRKVFISTYIG
jgi:ankyrin repeat protein